MPNIVEHGYLEEPYLEEPYLSGHVHHGVWSQVEIRIDATKQVRSQVSAMLVDKTKIVRSQVNRAISDLHNINSQISILINSEHVVESQIQSRIDTIRRVMSEIDRQLAANDHNINEEVDRAIYALHSLLTQVARRIDTIHNISSQVDRQLAGVTKNLREEIRRGSVLFIDHCEGYLEGDYLEDAYLTDTMCAKMRSQVERRIDATKHVLTQIELRIDTVHRLKEQVERRIDATKNIRSQVNRRLDKLKNVREQVERRIDDTHNVREQVARRIDALRFIHEQVNRLRAQLIHSQITQVLYNITNLRILCDFPSRGTDGTNWTASTTAVGDFSVNNLNTDIVEQVWRGATGVKTGISLICDTEVVQGVFVDTMGILNHNMTTSASVVWQGSNDPGFGTIGFTETLISTRTNIYYIAPTLPTLSFRYWRFLIDDVTNTADYIQWGTVVFGSSTIFQGECFVDRVIRQTTHFADKIQTEGFTNVSNDRALKFSVSLEFKNLEFLKGNYQRLREIFENDRTSLKCLWIPTPQYPSRFAVFGKLNSIPAESHNVKGATLDYVDFDITVDEAL